MRNRSKVGGADIDVRGNGGYIVAPPSVHPGDEKKGVPPGRIYAWAWGRSPDDLAFAAAPAWLVELCRPRDQVAATPPARGREGRAGRLGPATRYGEVVLDACVRAIGAAQKGTRDSTLYRFACKAAGLVPTGPPRAGLSARASCCGRRGPRARRHDPGAAGAAGRSARWPGARSTPGVRIRSARRAAATPGRRRASPLAAGRGAGGRRGLPRGAHTAAPAGGREWRCCTGWTCRACRAAGRLLRQGRPVLVLPLRPGPAPPDGAAVFALGGGGACLGLKGLSEGRVACWRGPTGATSCWCDQPGRRLGAGEAAFASGDPMAIVVAPRLSTFAGAPLGDRYGRVRRTCRSRIRRGRPGPGPGWPPVYLAVRRDLAGRS
jgi:hypothetical protein